MSFLRFLMLLALAVWLGALVFLPLAAATAFSTLPSPHLAGLVVRGSLLKLHMTGLICGAVFLACSMSYTRLMRGEMKVFASSHILIAVMLTLTALSQFRIIPRMDALRAGAGEIDRLGPADPIRVQFDNLHLWSTRMEAAVLGLGVLLLYLTSRRLAATRS